MELRGAVVTRNILGILVSFMMSAFAVFSLSLVVVQLSSFLHVPISSILVAVPLDFIGGALGAILIGRLSDTLGRKPMMLFSVLVFSIALISAAFIKSLYELYIVWFIMGIGVNSQNGISYPLLVETLQKSTGTIGGAIQGLYFLGFLLDALFYTLIRAWRAYFLLSGLLSLVLSVPSALVLVETGGKKTLAAQKQRISGKLLNYTIILSMITVAAFMLSVSLTGVVPTLLDSVGLPGYYTVVLSLVGFFGFIVAGVLSDRFEKWKVTLLFSFVGLIAGLALYVAGVGWLILTALGIAYVSCGFFGFIGVWASQTYPAGIRATATNTVFLLGRILGGFSPLLAVLVVSSSIRAGLSVIVTVSAAISIIGSLLYYTVSKSS
ncbi:MAG: MFS transporter [Thermoprotei archaeon]